MDAGLLIEVPPGRVTLTDRRTRRTWTVDVAAYRLGRLPVTQAEYAQVTGDRPSAAHGDRLPVESVSWWDAVRFCNARSHRDGYAPAYRLDGDDVSRDESADGYRLPTEAEWEHACRAGTGGPRYGPLDEIAWYRGNSGERIHTAGGKQPNAWGFHDLLGNSWDWCWDIYDAEVSENVSGGVSRTAAPLRPRLRTGHAGPDRTEENTMAKYLLLKHYRGGPAAVNDVPMDRWTPEEVTAHMQYMTDFAARLEGTGEFVDGQALSPEGTFVRYDGEGRPPVTDGPFAETKDLIAGWMVIDVDSYERALELAGELSAAPGAGGRPLHEWLEVRPFLTLHPAGTE